MLIGAGGIKERGHSIWLEKRVTYPFDCETSKGHRERFRSSFLPFGKLKDERRV